MKRWKSERRRKGEEGGAAVEVERVREREQQQGKERKREDRGSNGGSLVRKREERGKQSPNSSFSSFLFL
jgi:hypothetical protein